MTRQQAGFGACFAPTPAQSPWGSAEGQKKDSGLDGKAVVNGFIVVYPSGVQKSWNGGSDFGECCGYALSHKIDDVGFIRAVAAQVAADFPVDRRRVYASGLSNGCNMSQRFAVEAADVIAAAAFYSLANSEHVTYGHADGLDVAQIVWDNVKGYRLPLGPERPSR